MRPSAAVAAFIFLIVAAAQAFRYFNGWSVAINGTEVPLSLSLVGIIIPLVMAIWLLSDRSGSKGSRRSVH